MGFKCAHVTDVFDSYKKSKKSMKAVNVDSSYDGDKWQHHVRRSSEMGMDNFHI